MKPGGKPHDIVAALVVERGALVDGGAARRPPAGGA